MNPEHPSTSAPAWAVALTAALAVAVLWRYRGVLPGGVLAELLLPWLWLALWTLAAWGAGAPLAAARGAGGVVRRLALGSAVLSLAAVTAASVGLLRPAVLSAVLLGAAAAGAVALLLRRPNLEGLGAAWPAAAAVGLAALVIGSTLPAPPVMYDTLNYHLAFPAQWLRAGGFVEFPRHAYSYYPAAGGAAYGYALALPGPWAAKALHLWAGLLAAAVAGVLGARLAGRRAGAWAAVLFFLTPSVLVSATFATADLWVAAWGGAALLALVEPEDAGPVPSGRWAAAGFLGGSAAAAKILGLATVLFPLAVVALAVAVAGRRAGRPWAGPGFLSAAALLPLAPWLGRNLLWTGNPIYPYLRPLLGGPPAGFSIGWELLQNRQGAPGTLRWVVDVLLALPVRTFHPLQVAGNIGPLWLILLPVALLLPGLRRRRAFLPLAVWLGAGLLAWGSLVQFGRFLVPVLVGGAALAGAALAALTGNTGLAAARRALLALTVGVLAWNATSLLDRLTVERLGVTVGAAPPGRLLGHWVSYWPAARFVREKLPATARILMVAEPRTLYLDRDVVAEDPYRVPLLAELAARSRDGGELGRRLRARGITHLLVNEREMDRLARLRRAPDYWSGAGVHGRAVLGDFFAHGVRRVFEAPGLWVGALAGADHPGPIIPRSRTVPGGTGGSPGG